MSIITELALNSLELEYGHHGHLWPSHFSGRGSGGGGRNGSGANLEEMKAGFIFSVYNFYWVFDRKVEMEHLREEKDNDIRVRWRIK